MRKSIKYTALVAALASAITMSGCAAAKINENNEEQNGITTEWNGEVNCGSGLQQPDNNTPKAKTVSYITTTTNGVNLRSGAGTGYSVRGSLKNPRFTR